MRTKQYIGLFVAAISVPLVVIPASPATAAKVAASLPSKIKLASDREPRGPQGYPGPAGVQGPQGVPGARGLRGYRGYRGNRGYRGRRGHRGPRGRRGAAGQRGERGIQGERGPQGPSGQVQIETGTITTDDLANAAVTTIKIVDGAINNSKLAIDAVASVNILDGAIQIFDIAQTVWSENAHCSVTTALSLPTPSIENDGFICLATDENGGTLYRSNGSSWVKVARGATEPAPPVIQQATLIDSFPSLGDPEKLSANEHGPDYARVFPFTLNGTLTVNQVNIRTNTACTDALIAGIFDNSGASVWQSGVQSTVNGNLVITDSLPVTLTAGSQYYFASTNNNKTGGANCYSVTPALNQANVPRWGTVTTSAGAMPLSINPAEDITETTGGWMAFVTLSTFTT